MNPDLTLRTSSIITSALPLYRFRSSDSIVPPLFTA